MAGRPARPLSCASEVVRLSGGSDAGMVMAAGLAGGVGLSGCGALAAAIWMNSLSRIRDKSYKTSFSDPAAEREKVILIDVMTLQPAIRRIS